MTNREPNSGEKYADRIAMFDCQINHAPMTEEELAARAARRYFRQSKTFLSPTEAQSWKIPGTDQRLLVPEAVSISRDVQREAGMAALTTPR